MGRLFFWPMKAKDLYSYLELMTQFESGAIVADEFERGFLRCFKDDARDFPAAVYEILNGLFYAVDAYVQDHSHPTAWA